METPQNSQSPSPPRTAQLSAEEAARIQSRFMTRVYGWMAAALGITGGVALFASSSVALQRLVFGNRFVFLGLLLLELVIVGFLSARALRWTPAQVTAAFVGYSVLNGLTISFVFMVYTTASVASTFFIAGATFGVMSAYGLLTNATSRSGATCCLWA